MVTKADTRALLSLLLLGSALALLAILVPVAQAQCGPITSACYNCHESTDPVNGIGAWHSVFAHRYACWSCHGGNDATEDQASAHIGVIQNPLDDAYTSCYGCHPEDYQQKAAEYGRLLGMTVSFHVPPARTSAPLASSAIAPAAAPPASAPAPSAGPSSWYLALGLIPLAALVAGSWLVWRRR